MFKRGDVIRKRLFGDFRGVVISEREGKISVDAFGAVTGVFDADEFEAAPPEPEDAFRVALALNDTATALRLYREAQSSAASDRFYVYRKDDYEPGGLEYWNAFETVDKAKQEIETGLMYDEMCVVRAQNNVLSEILDYTRGWNADYTEVIYGWQTREQAPRQNTVQKANADE